ncbi:hypothetical protein OROMI_011088 [Orobanche minor]
MKGRCFGGGTKPHPIDIGEADPHVEDLIINSSTKWESSSSVAEINVKMLTFARKISSMAVQMMQIIEGASDDVAKDPSSHLTFEKAMKSIPCTPLQNAQRC